MIGKIKSINEKGFGFITVEGNSRGVFFHASTCGGEFDKMKEGDSVMIEEVIKTEKGSQAEGVSLIA